MAKSEVQKAAALSFYAGRSGDLVVVPALYWMAADAGTTHGSANDYDQHVPVVFMGGGIRAAKFPRPASPADIAPTLAKLIGVTMKSVQGRALDEVLSPSAARPSPASAR